ncbi:hypothetical protein Tco_0767853 [Tanacetum coccineum]
MFNKKLQADDWNEICYQLLKLLTKQLKVSAAGKKLLLLVMKVNAAGKKVTTAERLQLLKSLCCQGEDKD